MSISLHRNGDFEILLRRFLAGAGTWKSNTRTGVFTEKTSECVNFWHSNPCKQPILYQNRKNDERYSKFFKSGHVVICPHDLLYGL